MTQTRTYTLTTDLKRVVVLTCHHVGLDFAHPSKMTPLCGFLAEGLLVQTTGHTMRFRAWVDGPTMPAAWSVRLLRLLGPDGTEWMLEAREQHWTPEQTTRYSLVERMVVEAVRAEVMESSL